MGLDNTVTGSIQPQISVDKQANIHSLMYASFICKPPSPMKNSRCRKSRSLRSIRNSGARSSSVRPVKRLAQPFSGYRSANSIFVQPGSDAIGYGVRIGCDGFLWNSRSNIQYGKKWPTWRPPREMIAGNPELVKWAIGQPGSLENPLGARALHIYKDGQGISYRVHISSEWWTIGQAMSSGCMRMHQL